MTNTITMNEIQAELTNNAMKHVSEGFVITGGFTRQGFTVLEFKRGDETIRQDASSSHEDVGVYVVEFTENGELINKYYYVSDNVYTTSLETLNAINEKRMKRAKQSFVPRQRELNVKTMLKVIRTLPKFKTVAIKNLRVLRDTKTLQYTVENVTTRNKLVINNKNTIN